MVVGLGLPSVATGLFMPLTLVYFTVLTEIPLSTLGLITGTAVIATVPLPIVVGVMVDRWGASRVVAASLLIQACGFAGFTVARSAWAVFAVSAIMAIGNRVYWSSIYSAIAGHSDETAGRSSPWWFAVANVSRTVGITGGGVITGIVITLGSTAVYQTVAAAAAVLLVAAALVLPHERRRPPRGATPLAGLAEALRDLPFVGYTLVNSVFALSVLFLGLALPTTMRSALGGPGWLTAAYLTVNAVLVAALGLRAARWTERRTHARALAAAGIVWAVAYATIAVAVTLPLWGAIVPLAIAVAGIASAEAAQAPASMSWATLAAPRLARGRYLALFQYSWLIAEVTAPVVFASLFARAAWLPFALVSAANLVAVAALPAVARRMKARTNAPVE